jgi:hypothetical protein
MPDSSVVGRRRLGHKRSPQQSRLRLTPR